MRRILASLLVLSFVYMGLIQHDASVAISQELGPSINDEWIEAFSWIRENTPEDALIASWWDPGHWVVELGKRRSIADGAHCGPGSCYPYPINVRIVDMGRVLSTSDEDEGAQILSKYKALSEEDCKEVQSRFDVAPSCDEMKASKVYFIVYPYFIGIYPWFAYFGSGEKTSMLSLQAQSYSLDENGQVNGFIYADGYGGTDFSVYMSNGTFVPVYQNKYIVKNIAYYEQSEEGTSNLKTVEFEGADIMGTFWVGPSFMEAIYMPPEVEGSMFARMWFYDGAGLDNFRQVFKNGYVKIYEVQV